MPNFFGTLPLTSGVRTFANIGAEGLSGCVIGNESGLTCIITMQGSNLARSLYPGEVNFFPVGRGFTGIVQIDPSTQLANSSSWPGQFLQIDTYGSNEQPSGVYPLQLTRSTNVGNTVVTSAGVTADTLVNDGNAAGTQFVEATVSGDSSSAVKLTNSGVLTLGNSSHHGSISSDNAKFITDGSGNLLFGGKLGTTSAGNVLDAVTTASHLILRATGGPVDIESPSGTQLGSFFPDGTLSLTNTGQTTFTGPTSGNVKFYLLITGTIKIMIANFNNYQNNTANRQTFTFPESITMTAPTFWIATEIPGLQGFTGVTGQQFNIITALAAGGGTTVQQNNINKASFGYFRTTSIDNLKDTINDASAHSGQLIGIGFL